MNITIINDCRDDNAKARQVTRAQALMGGSVSFVGVASDLEAAGNLIDVLDAYENNPGVVLVNVAPRNGSAKKWKNGTPFCHFMYRNVLVVATIDGLTLSLVKKLGLVKTVSHMDTATVVAQMVEKGAIDKETGDRIVRTQFRSYDFAPRVAAFLQNGNEVSAEVESLDTYQDAPDAVWWVDNFGNCKTTVLGNEFGTLAHLDSPFGNFPFVLQLKDVEDGEVAAVVGSSGIGDQRFVEIVVQGESAAENLGIQSGNVIRQRT